MHLVGEQAAIAWFVGIGSKKVSSARAERAVGKGFHGADAKLGTAESVADAEFSLVVDVVDDVERRRFAWCSSPRLEKFPYTRDVGELGRHVLHAGDADGSGMCRGAFHGVYAVIVRRGPESL